MTAEDIDNHGTPAGYQRHRYWGEDACDPCRKAWTEYYRAYRNLQREKKET